MADFQSQAMGLTGLTIDASSTTPSRAEFSTFLNDGVIDVTNRWLAIKPQDIENFTRESAEQTSNGFNPGTSEIFSVIRESGTDGEWYPCNKKPINLQYLVTDVESLHYASKYNPVYMITQNRNVHVYPAPSGAGNDGFKVLYVNYSPEETDGTALDHASTGIKWFPDDKVYLVVLYASIRSLQAKMADTTITDLSVNAVPPDVPNNPSISSPGVATVTLGSLGTAPTLTSTTLTTRVSFNDFFESGSLNPFDDSDPSAFSITAVPPDVPVIATISYSNASNDDASVTGVSTATASEMTTVNVSSHAPTYTPPAIEGASTELTEMEAISGTALGTDTDFYDFEKWFTALGEMIEDEEDTELAQAQIGKISTYIQAYGQAMQNQLNEFNEGNVRYQMEFQEAVTKENQDLQVAIANANNLAQEYRQEAQQSTQIDQFNKQQDQALNLANAAKTMESDMADNNSKVQKYTAELQSYQAEVGAQVQEYTQKLQRYTLEVSNTFQAWQKTESDSLQQYQLDIQANLNEFNEDNVIYQSTVQEAIQNATIAAQEAQKEGDLTLQAAVQDYTLKLQKYQADYAGYTAEITSQIQEYTQNLQADGMGYQWLQGQYAALKAEYDQAFMIAAPKQQPQQQAGA